ncbi:ABC transporter substrate-binding protein [Flavobacterium sp. F-328]|uniref:Thiamine pyrimidine synthase n=1 Tax=Flavobacterium erciyesense TaxID=2825842 RepID=A0ABS5D795_9FLAO|nr:ABC transporter substrate-binding protein [Flavobacterium erciyesense]MBQ0909914.1 ABC transporter substrate-binding protein [Flavobacterium erciyesense]
MKTITLALDWTPNVNHIGILVAKELGYYTELGIDLEIGSPLTDNYQFTPGKKLELDLATFVLAPFETVISLNNKANKVEARAIYALLQEDLSSIASLSSSKMTSPRHLDGKIYASYQARYEDKIVQELVKNDGGTGDFEISYPAKLGIWNTLLSKQANATWIFNNWEGIEAKNKNIALECWSMTDFGIPYGYSPVVITTQKTIEDEAELCEAFVKATQRGYLFASQHKEKAVAILSQYVTEEDRPAIDLTQALEATIPYFGEENNMGFMKPERVESFLKWLVIHNLEEEQILNQTLYNNTFCNN